MYHAVHLITESCDHYNLLVKADTLEELLPAIQEQVCQEELEYVGDFYLSSEDKAVESQFSEYLGRILSELWEERDRREFGEDEGDYT